jgi:signal transduction histidine kinase
MKTTAANGTCSVDPEMSELVEESLKGATHIRDIVRDLSSFSSKSPDQVESVDINSSIRFCVNIAANELKHRARVELDLDALPQIKAVKGRLQQAILNVIVNAAQSIAPGKPADNCLKVSTRREGNNIHIRVADTGCGIPNNILRRIFDPFFTTKEDGAGTGLGLSITSEIIKKHGGTINIETIVGKGTVFIISLPIRGNAG